MQVDNGCVWIELRQGRLGEEMADGGWGCACLIEECYIAINAREKLNHNVNELTLGLFLVNSSARVSSSCSVAS